MLQHMLHSNQRKKVEYSKIKDSNTKARELVLVGVETVKSPMSKLLSLKDPKVWGAVNMKEEVPAYVDMLIAAHLLQD